MIENVLVLGAGSAGLIAAITLQHKLPQFKVRVLRSREIGVIGVGEGTTPVFPKHLFQQIGIPAGAFYAMAEPTWKIGIKFLWGPRGRFDYTFSHQMDAGWSDLPKENGFHCDGDFRNVDLAASLMHHDKVFARNPRGGGPDIQPWHGFHIENRKLVDVLEKCAVEGGVEIIDGTMTSARRWTSCVIPHGPGTRRRSPPLRVKRDRCSQAQPREKIRGAAERNRRARRHPVGRRAFR